MMKKTVKVLAIMVVTLAAVFALIFGGNVVFTMIALHGETADGFEEASAPTGSVADITKYSMQAAANGIRNEYKEYGEAVPISAILARSFKQTVGVLDYSGAENEREAGGWYSEHQQRMQDLELRLKQDNWNTINSSTNRELLEGTKTQRLEILFANGKVLQVLDEASAISELIAGMDTDSWELTLDLPQGLEPQYKIVIYQEVEWPAGTKVEKIGQYITYAGEDYVQFQMTMAPMGYYKYYLKIPAEVSALLSSLAPQN